MKVRLFIFPFLFLVCSFQGKTMPGSVSLGEKGKSSNDTIIVMSFNIRSCRPVGKKIAIVDSTAAAIVRHKPDIVLLQEVDNGTKRSLRQDQTKLLAEKTGLLNYYFVKTITEDDGEFGDAIISKFPIIEKEGLMLPKVPVEGRYVEQRGLNIVKLRLPSGADICVACSHFALTQENRILQAHMVVEKLSTVNLPVIFAADLNAHPGSPTLTILDSTFSNTSKNDCFTFPVPEPKVEIDFIMYMPSTRINVISNEVCLDEMNASDHFPVISRIEIKNGNINK